MFGLQIKQGQAGQALIEAALALPVLLMLSFLMIDVGTGFFVRNTMNNVARDEARILATDPKLNPNYRPPVGSTQTPQQAVAQAISDAKTRITIRIAPIAGMGKPLSVSNDGIQILVPGVNGTPGNLTDNPVEVRITRQLNLISANFIPDAAADRIINTSVSASAFVEKGTISGDINLVTENGRSITTETDLCQEGEICTCETDKTLCTREELCKFYDNERAKCTLKERCDFFGECGCKYDISKCSNEELCEKGNTRSCCVAYGGEGGNGKKPNGEPACSDSDYCWYGTGNKISDRCCKVAWNYFCPGNNSCEQYKYYLSLLFPDPLKLGAYEKYYVNYFCCPLNPAPAECCDFSTQYCSNSTKCERSDINACCQLEPGQPGSEKCHCQYDINRCSSGSEFCQYYPNSDQCCQFDQTKCNGEQLCRLKGDLASCTTDCLKCSYASAKDPDACCRCRSDWCSDNNICTYYDQSTRCRCLPGGEGTTSECCVYRRDTSLACCQANMNQCKPVDVCSVYPDQPKCKVEG